MSTDANSSKSVSSNRVTGTANEKNRLGKEDDICEDWEQLDQMQIKKSLQSIKITQNNDNEERNIKSTAKPGVPFNASANQMNNNPIKILRRPPSDKNLKDMNLQVQANTSQPIKTFEQREQEYAQARLRILGSAHPEPDTSNTTPNSTTDNNSNSNFNKNNLSQQNSYSNANKQTLINQNNSYNGANNSRNNNNPSNNLIREPTAPDGTRGFNQANRFYQNNTFNSNNSSNSNSNSNSNNYKNKS